MVGVGGYGILGYWFRDTIQFSSHHINYDGISDDGSLGVSLVTEEVNMCIARLATISILIVEFIVVVTKAVKM